MQMTLTITAENTTEMEVVLAALQGAGVAPRVNLVTGGPLPEGKPQEPVVPAAVSTPEPVVQTPKRGRPAKTAGPAAETATSEPAAKEPAKLKVVPKDKEPIHVEAVVEGEVERKDVTILDVRKALTEYLAANDETKAAALLAKHGHTDRLSKLEEQYFDAVYYAAVTPAVKEEFFNDDISDVGVSQ